MDEHSLRWVSPVPVGAKNRLERLLVLPWLHSDLIYKEVLSDMD